MALDLMEIETLSDEQIELLLQEAEGRLRAKAGAVAVPVAPENELSLRLDENKPEFAKRKPIPRLQHELNKSSYIKDQDGVAEVIPELLATKEQQKLADKLRSIESKNKSKKEDGPADAGKDWFNMPLTKITPALKRDLQLIQMRSVLDTHRHYKKNNSKKSKVPQFSQTGTIVEGPTEFYSSRINKKDRAKTFLEEAMNTERQTGRFKRKYEEIQNAKTSGKKAHYKKLMAKRKKR